MPLWLEPPIISAATTRMMVTPMPSCSPAKMLGMAAGMTTLSWICRAIGAEVLRRLDQATVDLADAGIGADHDRERTR